MAVKFVSLNIWNGGMLIEKPLHFLDGQNADIILLQEIYHGTEQRLPLRFRSPETLLNQLPYPNHTFSTDYLEKHISGALARRDNAILSKFPIWKSDASFFDKPYSETYFNKPHNAYNCPRNIQHALVDTLDQSIHVFSMVMLF